MKARLWFCTWKGWRANLCSCNIGGYSYSMTGCGWVDVEDISVAPEGQDCGHPPEDECDMFGCTGTLGGTGEPMPITTDSDLQKIQDRFHETLFLCRFTCNCVVENIEHTGGCIDNAATAVTEFGFNWVAAERMATRGGSVMNVVFAALGVDATGRCTDVE